MVSVCLTKKKETDSTDNKTHLNPSPLLCISGVRAAFSLQREKRDSNFNETLDESSPFLSNAKQSQKTDSRAFFHSLIQRTHAVCLA